MVCAFRYLVNAMDIYITKIKPRSIFFLALPNCCPRGKSSCVCFCLCYQRTQFSSSKRFINLSRPSMFFIKWFKSQRQQPQTNLMRLCKVLFCIGSHTFFLTVVQEASLVVEEDLATFL